MQVNSKRVYFLDGIRGWGAVSVLLYHLFIDSFPLSRLPADTLHKFLLLNGTFAVWIFFVVSGFALSVGYFSSGEANIPKKILAARYFRLAIPILAMSLIVYAGARLGLIPSVETRPSPFRNSFLEIPSLLDTLRFALYGVFFHYDPYKSLIAPLWTMPYEMYGSFLVLGLVLLVRRWKYRLGIWVVALAVSASVNDYYAAFMAGLLFSEIYVSSVMVRFERYIFLAFLSAMPFILYAGSYLPESGPSLYFILAAVVSFFCFFEVHLRRFFSNSLSRYLGKISFSLYLVHMPVLWLIGLRLHRQFENPLACNLVLLVLCFAFATLFERVERVGHKLSSRIGTAAIELGAQSSLDA